MNTTPFPGGIERIENLECRNNEKERKERLLEVSITHTFIDIKHTNLDHHVREFFSKHLLVQHPTIENKHTNLDHHVHEFLSNHLLIQHREIDSGFFVSPSPDPKP